MKYTLYVDGTEVTTHDKIKSLKKEAEFWFENLNAFDAKIVKGNVTYLKQYDDKKWWRMEQIKQNNLNN